MQTMPPRSKSAKVEFIHCSLCGCKFSNKDQGSHTELCTENVPLNTLSFPHGFVVSNCLHGLLSRLDGPNDVVPRAYEDCLIQIHPLTMRLCDFHLAGPVVVNDQAVLLVWPNPSLPLTTVGISSSTQELIQLSQGDLHVSVKMLPPPHHSASEIKIMPVNWKNVQPSDDFCEYFKQRQCGKFVSKGTSCKLNYFGQECEVCITEVTRGKVTATQDQSLLSSDVSAALNKMTITSPGSSQDKTCASDNIQCTFYKISESTHVTLVDSEQDDNLEKPGKLFISLDQVGGLRMQKEKIQELIDLQLKPVILQKPAGMTLPRGILLYGPSGVGKSMLLQAAAHYSQAHVISLSGAQIWSKFYGETEAKIASVFREAKERAPSVIIIDEIDVLCPRRESSQNEAEKRVVAALLSQIDAVFASDLPVMLLTATNKPDDLDAALRRPGRLDREIEVGVPTAAERAEILEKMVANMTHELNMEDIQVISNKAHGFVGADLAAVCKDAGVHALKRGESVTRITMEDMMYGMKITQPSAMREVALEVPQVSWADIGGQHELKQKLRQAIEWPLLHPEAFQRLGIRPPRGLLMYGPPGCSKTMIAKALAKESGINFIAIKGPELYSKWVGESERAVRELFRKARAAAPAIVFFDEIDALAGERGSHGGGGGEVSDRVLAQLLTEIDGVDALKDVTIVAATNRPDRIDKALLRPGRLDRIVYVPLPDDSTRNEIFNIHFKRTPVADDVNIDDLVSSTAQYSGAEISAVCQEAALCAMQEDIDIAGVHKRHFDQALTMVTPRITPELIDFYQSYQEKSGLHSV